MNASAALPFERPTALKSLKPMGLIESILLFGIPAVVLAASLWLLWPILVDAGMDGATAYAICLSWVNAGLLAASVVGHGLEGNPLTWSAYAQRMRLTRMSGKVWLWTILGTLFYLVLTLLINIFATSLFSGLMIPLPKLPWPSVHGWMSAIVLFFNIAGEELWWRGYILPRQELAFGKRTPLVHGILWACFHMFKWYQVPFFLLNTWVIPFIAQRTKNTWPGIIAHASLNSASPIAVFILNALKLL